MFELTSCIQYKTYNRANAPGEAVAVAMARVIGGHGSFYSQLTLHRFRYHAGEDLGDGNKPNTNRLTWRKLIPDFRAFLEEFIIEVSKMEHEVMADVLTQGYITQRSYENMAFTSSPNIKHARDLVIWQSGLKK